MYLEKFKVPTALRGIVGAHYLGSPGEDRAQSLEVYVPAGYDVQEVADLIRDKVHHRISVQHFYQNPGTLNGNVTMAQILVWITPQDNKSLYTLRHRLDTVLKETYGDGNQSDSKDASDFMGCKIPVGVTKATVPREASFNESDCLSPSTVSFRACFGIDCNKCIFDRINLDVARKYFDCYADAGGKKLDDVSKFKDCKVPPNVTPSHVPSHYAVNAYGCRCGYRQEIPRCFGIRCDECILNVRNSSIASEYFDCYKNKKQESEKIMNNHTKPTVLDRVAMYYESTEAVQIYVPDSFDIFKVKAAIEADTYYALSVWEEKRLLFMPKTKIDLSDINYMENSVARLYGDRGNVDGFLNDTDACPGGREFVRNCDSLSEVWDLCIDHQKWSYVSFIVTRIAEHKNIAARYVTNSENLDKLKHLNAVLVGTEMWCMIDADYLKTLNPFKEKEN